MLKEYERRGMFLLCEKKEKAQNIYREIVELVARFSFVSAEEIAYGFDLTPDKAGEKLRYLSKLGLLDRFDGIADPKSLYCLTSFGRKVAQLHRVSDEVHPFAPSHYYVLNQRHDRMLTRIYLALRKIFEGRLKGWSGELTLRQNEGFSASPVDPAGRRIMDGMFLLEPELAFSPPNNYRWCGLELELTLKSAERYRKQFRGLADTVYDSFERKQKVPLVLFLYGSETIARALHKYWDEQRDQFGQYIFFFGSADRFLNERGEAPLTRYFGDERRTLQAKELACVSIALSSGR